MTASKGFNGDQFLEAEVQRLVKTHGIKTVIETGTYLGDSTKAFATMGPKVYSVELEAKYFMAANWDLDNVEVILGYSPQVLKLLLRSGTLEGPILFYLDAHWGEHSPLLEELKVIAESGVKPAVIIIHDFFNPERPEFGFDTWDIGPYKLELIAPLLKEIYGDGGGYYYNDQADGQKRGVIFIGPAPFSPPPLITPTVGVVYLTYKNDLCWICYSLQLLVKHLKGPYRITVIAEPDCQEIIKTWGLPVTYHYVEPWKDGYAFAMYQKSLADQYTDSELIMILDSDHMLLEPCALGSFFIDAKPIIRYRPWDQDPNDPGLAEGRRQWAPPTERVLGIPLDHDYMLGPPFLFWRDTFQGLRNRIEEVTGLSFHDAVYSAHPYHYTNFLKHPKVYCDYEALGLYAARFEPERYSLVPHVPGQHWPFRVFWSHGDWSAPLQAQFDELLKT
jgi:hypothetical protein